MDKYEFLKWMNKRLQNGRTIAEEIKYVDVCWTDEKGEFHSQEIPSFPEAVEYAKKLNLNEKSHLLFFYHSVNFGLKNSY